MHAGDLVDTPTNDNEWGEWFSAGGWINGMVPSIATPGNHEYSGSTSTPYWRTQFDFPDNGPQGTGPVYDALKDTAYYTDYQGVRFISLNSNTARRVVVAAPAVHRRPGRLARRASWRTTRAGGRS